MNAFFISRFRQVDLEISTQLLKKNSDKKERKKQNVGHDFLYLKSGHYLQNFLLAQIERMQADSSLLSLESCFSSSFGEDIFSKYLAGCDVSHLPFQLFKAPSIRKRSSKKGGVRGPYRRYTSEEKLQIIQRMLCGQPLKKIAQKTMIPKRNLIRWKHEYLHHGNQPTPSEDQDQSVELDYVETDIKKDSMETREILATESMDLIRLQ